MLTSKKLTLLSFAAIMCSTGQTGFAHTSIQNSVDVSAKGSGTIYNNIVIGHGCEDPKNANNHFPVIAQSLVFPTNNPVITEGSAGTVSTKTIADLLQKSATDTTTPVTSLANYAQLIQSNDVFSSQREKLDATGNVIGFEGLKGKLNPALHGLIPFRFNAVFFKPTACIKTLKVNIAVADICKLTFKAGGPLPGAANTWFPSKTNKFTQDLDGIGSPATLTFTNTNTAADPSCGTTGNDKEYIITPTNTDVDANMPIKKYWGK